MTKEPLTLENVCKDLRRVAYSSLSNAAEWRFTYIIPVTILAVLIGILLENLWIGLAIFAFAVYHIVRYVMAYRVYRTKKKAIEEIIDRGDISIAEVKLSHIATETIYEPHTVGRRARSAKDIRVFHFIGGGSWRVPEVDMHYGWSKELMLSPAGLENVSISADDFFFISLQGHYDIAYVYPVKFFQLTKELENNGKGAQQ